MTVCVNVSARQFKEKNLVSRVVGALKDSGLDRQTSRAGADGKPDHAGRRTQAVATMKELQGLGVQLSIDDFGTGYSSLSALKTFPVARLKIDKSFIDGLPVDENDKAVASAVISLGAEAQSQGHRRRRRNGRTGRVPAREQLRRNAGLSFQQAGPAAGPRGACREVGPDPYRVVRTWKGPAASARSRNSVGSR